MHTRCTRDACVKCTEVSPQRSGAFRVRWLNIAFVVRDVIERAHMMMRIQKSVPQELWREVQKPREPVDIKPGVDVYLTKGSMVGQVLLLTAACPTACRVRIDATGIGHAVLTTQYDLRFYELYQVQKWKGRWSQPRGPMGLGEGRTSS